MKLTINKLIYGIGLLIVSFCSCSKYLDKKPLKSQVVPSSLTDLQAILDNNARTTRGETPALIEALADNYYITTANWQSIMSGPWMFNRKRWIIYGTAAQQLQHR